jgi:peptide methionine sulfoxide reductase MsrA
METATFATASAQSLEAALRAVDGVHETRLGTTEEPASAAVEVDYDPWRVAYDDLLMVFWAELDPGSVSAIFPHTVEQHAAAEASRSRLGQAATEILATGGRFRRSAPS